MLLKSAALHRLPDFVRESLAIESIHRDPTADELEATKLFLALEHPTVAHLRTLVGIFEPTAQLREHRGMDVRIADHLPLRGGPAVVTELSIILTNLPSVSAHDSHLAYEHLHPFTDCNGRSGRTLWAWRKLRSGYDLRRLFLHEFYYDTLSSYHHL